jgi:hypothetical protein
MHFLLAKHNVVGLHKGMTVNDHSPEEYSYIYTDYIRQFNLNLFLNYNTILQVVDTSEDNIPVSYNKFVWIATLFFVIVIVAILIYRVRKSNSA